MEHINSIGNSTDKDRNYLYKAMETYGHTNFGIAVLQVALERENETSEDFTKRVVDIENRWMFRLDTVNHGLNAQYEAIKNFGKIEQDTAQQRYKRARLQISSGLNR